MIKDKYLIDSSISYFITGSAGFIGFHLSKKLLGNGCKVIGIDNLNDYYDVNIKKDRLKILETFTNFKFIEGDIGNKELLSSIFDTNKIDVVVNLAAQAGVRYSISNPDVYIQSNIVGFMNVLENARHNQVKHLVYASSSSVYGMNENIPFSTNDNVDHPISLYAATKKSNELMAHTYSHLYGLPTTGLRFFTVYGPWGRPDMALFLFTDAIINGKPINVFNKGNMIRDFTYVDDIVEGITRLLNKPPKPDPNWDNKTPNPGNSSAPYKIYNIGNNKPVKLMEFISAIEKRVGKKAIKNYLGLQDGDVPITCADVDDLIADIGFQPNTNIIDGINNFITWYEDYYGVN